MNISEETLNQYRKEFNSRMMNSNISEYCPTEFEELLNYVDYLKKRLLKYERGLFVCPDCGYNVLGSEFLTQNNSLDDDK